MLLRTYKLRDLWKTIHINKRLKSSRSEFIVLTVAYEVSWKASSICAPKCRRGLLSDHTALWRDGEHRSAFDGERAFLVLLSYDKYHCQVFTTTSLKYQVIHTHNLTRHKEDWTDFSELQNGICRMSPRNDKGTSLALTKRTMFPLGHYKTIAFRGGGGGSNRN